MLTQIHQNELRNSCIDPDVAALNFHSIDGTEIYEFLCYSEKLERLNAGRLASKWLDRYSHCEAGGWWCSGLDPLDDWQPMAWGCFKPDSPKEDYQKPEKFIKYEHCAKTETRAFFLKVTFALGSKIAKKLGLEKDYGARILQAYTSSQKVELRETGAETREPARTRGQGFAKDFRKSSRSWNSSTLRRIYSRRERVAAPSAKWLRTTEDKGFWAWVLDNPKIPVIIVEGAKKAGCLLTAGYAAIALPGIAVASLNRT